MKRMIKASDAREYDVLVSFAGYVGSENEYNVTADDEDEAMDYAKEEARDDLEIEFIEDLGDGDYNVTINFAGMVGVEQTYSVVADSKEEAGDYALDEAYDDLDAELA